MTVTLVGAIFIGAGVVAWFGSRRAFLALLVTSAPFVTTAAVSVGGNSVPPFFVLAVLATISAIVTWMRGIRVRHPSLKLLGVFVAWAVLVTAVGPSLFAGIPVLDPRGGIDFEVYDPTPLTYAPSMAAQAAYLIVAVGAVLYIAQTDDLNPGFLTPAFVVGTILSAIRLVPGTSAVLDPVFRNYASVTYNQWDVRHHGVFAEPSYLAVFSIAALAYLLYRAPQSKPTARAWLTAIAGVAVVNLALSSSGTAALSAAILLVIAFVYYGSKYLFRRMKLHPLWLLAPIAFVVALITPNPITDSIIATIRDKIGTQSYSHRTSADAFSLDLLGQTFGLGVGLGANRPSSFLLLTLSTVGIIGTILLAATMLRAVRGLGQQPRWVPVGVALLAILVTKTVAEPSMSTPLLWLSLAGCIYATRIRDAGEQLAGVNQRSSLLAGRAPSEGHPDVTDDRGCIEACP